MENQKSVMQVFTDLAVGESATFDIRRVVSIRQMAWAWNSRHIFEDTRISLKTIRAEGIIRATKERC